jgi:hypothetical protein
MPPPLFFGTLGLRVGLTDVQNLDMVRTGLYRVQLSAFGQWGKERFAGIPNYCQAAPQRLCAVSKGVSCGPSPVHALVAELDDEGHTFTSRSVHVRFTDEVHEINEACNFVFCRVPLDSCGRLCIRLRLLRAEPPKVEGEEVLSAAFTPVATRTLCLSAGLADLPATRLALPLLFEMNYLACVGCTVHCVLLDAAFCKPAFPAELTLPELAAEARLPPPRPAPPAAAAALAKAAPPAPPQWSRRFFTYARGFHSLKEFISPATHRAAVQTREQALGTLVGAALALLLSAGGSEAAGGAPVAAPAAQQVEPALQMFNSSVASAMALEWGGGPGLPLPPPLPVVEEAALCPENLALATRLLATGPYLAEVTLREWREELLGLRGGGRHWQGRMGRRGRGWGEWGWHRGPCRGSPRCLGSVCKASGVRGCRAGGSILAGAVQGNLQRTGEGVEGALCEPHGVPRGRHKAHARGLPWGGKGSH